MKKRNKTLMTAILAATMIATTSISVFAGSTDGWTEAANTSAAGNGAWSKWCQTWDSIKNNPTEMSLTPGKNATELNFGWYSKSTDTNPKLKFGKKQDLSDARDIAVATQNGVTGYMSNKATVTGLEENTQYYYSYQINGQWTAAIAYKTQSTKSFSFLYVGDPQIGSSSSNTATGATATQGQDNASRNDSFNWNNTLNTALKAHPEVSFMVSAGDQIQSGTNNEIEYSGYLTADALKSLPVATTIGNHDSSNANYSLHFNNPNASNLGLTTAGGDYYYTYGNTLFIDLNTNNVNVAEHQQLIEKAISENPTAKWRIVTIHQDIYGSGEHSNEPAVVSLRYNLIPIFEKNNIDAVLTGHDHTYSRSLILKGGVQDPSKMITATQFNNYSNGTTPVDSKFNDYLANIDDSEAVVNVTTQDGNVVDPKGILYMTANSSSGSKYYDLVAKQQSYIASRWQQDIPTYSTINVDEVSFTINTFRTDTGEKIDNTFTIVKSLDKSNLNDLITSAGTKATAKDKYTTSSYAKLDAALTAAKNVSAKAASTSQQIADAYTNLKNAADGLDVKGDTTSLQKSINDTQSLYDNAVVGTANGQYSASAKADLKTAIDAARATLASADANQVAVDKATAALSSAVDKFKGTVVNSTAVTTTTASTNSVKTSDEFNGYVVLILLLAISGALYVNRKAILKRVNR